MKPISMVIVDNHSSTRRILKKVLDLDERIRVIGSATNGIEAIDQVKKLNPEIVLMDIKMPKMDGLDATKMIVEKYPDTKVIVLTAYSEKNLQEKAAKIGASRYLSKNYPIEDIINVIIKECRGSTKYKH